MTIVETHAVSYRNSTDVSPSLALPLPGDEPTALGAKAVTPLMFAAASVAAMMYVIAPLSMFLVSMLKSEIDAIVVAVASALLAMVLVRLLLRAILAPRPAVRRARRRHRHRRPRGSSRPTPQADREFR